MTIYFVSNKKDDAKAALEKAVPAMAQSCTISTVHGDIQFDGQQAQALSEVVASMISERTTIPALDFYNEVIAYTESLTALADEYGHETVMDLFYLHGALHTPDGWIEALPPSRIVEFVRTLPSAPMWMERVKEHHDA